MNHLKHYPFRDTAPGRCFLWHHPKTVVQWYPSGNRMQGVEVYDCACGKYYWVLGRRYRA